jgi:hypothetical protein
MTICAPVFTVFCIVCTVFFCIASFMYIYSYLFCLYKCKDYCHRVTTSSQLVVIVVVVAVVVVVVVVVIIIIINLTVF